MGGELSNKTPGFKDIFAGALGGLQCSECQKVHAECSSCGFRAPRAVGRAGVTFGVPGESFVSSGATAEPLLTLFAIWAKAGEGAGVTGVTPIRIPWP